MRRSDCRSSQTTSGLPTLPTSVLSGQQVALPRQCLILPTCPLDFPFLVCVRGCVRLRTRAHVSVCFYSRRGRQVGKIEHWRGFPAAHYQPTLPTSWRK